VVIDDLASSSRPLVDLGDALLGPVGGILLLATVVTSVGGNLLASMFSAPRITFGMAEQGMLPPLFARINPRRQTPAVSIAVFAVLAWLLAATGSFIWLASLSVLIRVLIYVACISALPRVRQQAVPGGLQLPGGLLIPGIAALMCLLLLVQVTAVVYLATAGLLAFGSLLFWVARRARA
jgi:amino acid transporter